MHAISEIVMVGIGATLVLDAWSLVRTRLCHARAPDFGMIGRWVGHFARGRFRHDAIATAAPIPGELAIGWGVHFATGVAYAALLVALVGRQWLHDPTPYPALAVGIATVAAPFLLMQPGMGLGIAGSRAARPNTVRAQSLVNHAVFGLGLYLAASALVLLRDH